MEYKNQHYVTEAYLRAWLDPNTPQGAYVWVISKHNRKVSRKAPRKLFAEEDFYTIYDSDGKRILELEHKLKEVEDKFMRLRDGKLRNHEELTPEDRRALAVFISTMFARTKRYKEEEVQIWQEYIDFVESLPPEMSLKIKQTNEYNDVIGLHIKQPMPFHLFYFVNMTAPYLEFMNCGIYETKSNPGLITSDNPCFWFDPAIYNPNAPLTFFGIGSPTLNILFPTSPTQYISLLRDGPDGYIDLHTKPDVEEELVDLINGFTATNCEEFIVVNQNTFKERWFDEKVK